MTRQTNLDRFQALYNVTNKCWEWTAYKNQKGYGQFNWWEGGSYEVRYAHRCSYELYIGPITNNLHVLHRCDNPACVNPNHLFLGTVQDNIIDKINKCRHKTGESAPSAKLTKEQVLQIRVGFETNNYRGYQRDMALLYNVDKKTIYSICHNINWKQI